jgi:hypothetical protein
MDIHWHRVCGKFHTLSNVKVVDGLDEADAAHLKEIV